METDRRMFVLMFISSFALASVVGYVGFASAQNMTTGSNMTSNTTMGNSLDNTTIGTAKELEKLTGNNTQFNNTALSNLRLVFQKGYLILRETTLLYQTSRLVFQKRCLILQQTL